MRLIARLASIALLPGLAAVAMQGCATPAQDTLSAENRQAANDAARSWVDAMESGNHDSARAAEERLEKVVGRSQVMEWKLYSALNRWADNLLELESGRTVYTKAHPGFVRMNERDDLLKRLVDDLIARAPEGPVRVAVARVTEDLRSRRFALMRDVEELEQTHLAGAPALVAAKSRLAALDEVVRRIKVLTP